MELAPVLSERSEAVIPDPVAARFDNLAIQQGCSGVRRVTGQDSGECNQMREGLCRVVS